MNIGNINTLIPGTLVTRDSTGSESGMLFLRRVFFATDGIKLSRIRELCGVDGTTLQNWVKRGWILNPVNKMYDMDSFARILIINMMRDAVQLSKISFLLEYISGSMEREDDDVAKESLLYDYVCRVIDGLSDKSDTVALKGLIEITCEDYTESFEGAKERLIKALEIIVCAYRASLVKRYTESLFDDIEL